MVCEYCMTTQNIGCRRSVMIIGLHEGFQVQEIFTPCRQDTTCDMFLVILQCDSSCIRKRIYPIKKAISILLKANFQFMPQFALVYQNKKGFKFLMLNENNTYDGVYIWKACQEKYQRECQDTISPSKCCFQSMM